MLHTILPSLLRSVSLLAAKEPPGWYNPTFIIGGLVMGPLMILSGIMVIRRKETITDYDFRGRENRIEGKAAVQVGIGRIIIGVIFIALSIYAATVGMPYFGE